jgi:hypothetical protein
MKIKYLGSLALAAVALLMTTNSVFASESEMDKRIEDIHGVKSITNRMTIE